MERNPTKTDTDFLLRQITTEDNKLSFQRLFELYYPALCIYTKRFIPDRETREDIVQEVFSSIWENRKRIVIRTSARNYLITATKNHCLNYLQRNHEEYVDKLPQEQIPIYADSGEELYTWEELQTLLREALAKKYIPHRIKVLKLALKDLRRIALRIRVTARSQRICKYPYGQ